MNPERLLFRQNTASLSPDGNDTGMLRHIHDRPDRSRPRLSHNSSILVVSCFGGEGALSALPHFPRSAASLSPRDTGNHIDVLYISDDDRIDTTDSIRDVVWLPRVRLSFHAYFVVR